MIQQANERQGLGRLVDAWLFSFLKGKYSASATNSFNTRSTQRETGDHLLVTQKLGLWCEPGFLLSVNPTVIKR